MIHMNAMTIGLMGCLVNSTNLGCIALTYTLLQNLEEIGRELEKDVRYIIFDERPSWDAMERLSKDLSIDISRLKLGTVGALQTYNLKGKLRACTKMLCANIKMFNDIRKCDVVIDMTGGDSFSDIYGKERFYKQTAAKRLVERLGIPLILGPQTYGPFNDPEVKKYAQKTIESAKLVMSRDDASKTFLSGFCRNEVVAVTDLAFGLKYDKKEKQDGRIRIGINPSGLLSKHKVEATNLDIPIKTDYDAYVSELIRSLTQRKEYEIHLISHVGDEAQKCFPDLNGVIYHPPFHNPIAAKNVISTMDVFIGSRMHATIAAFSSGVPTIPVAYSRKFSGLFHALGYNYIVDLLNMETEEALSMTLDYIERKDELKQAIDHSDVLVKEKYDVLLRTLKSALAEICNHV